MKKVIRTVDSKRGILQCTLTDERWYLKSSEDPTTGLPVYKAVPSSTWIASFYPKGTEYYRWLADRGWDEAEAIKQEAGDKGSAVHAAIEMILNGEEFRIDTKVPDKSRSTELEAVYRELTFEELLCVNSFIDWRNDVQLDYVIESLATETTVFSETHNFAGTVDWVLRLTPKPECKNPLKLSGPTPYVVDFKTSKAIYRAHEIQVSSYREVLENGENPLMEKNENGTETGKLIDLSGLKTAILQVGYTRNKVGYKFTEIDDAFPLFKVAQQIWQREAGSQDIKQYTFPLVLSAGRKVEAPIVSEEEVSVDDAMPEQSEEIPLPAKTKKTKHANE